MKTLQRIGGLLLVAVPMLAIAITFAKSEPQPPTDPTNTPEPAAGQTKPVEMPTYNPQAIVKPAYVPAKGEWKRYKIDGYYRWVWFSPNDKPVQSSKNVMVCGDCAGSGVEDGEVCSRCKGTGFVSTAPKATMQSGGCANGQCGRGWGRRGR